MTTPLTLAPLPYPIHALEPWISRETVHVHYETHHRGYLEKLKGLLEKRPERPDSLEALVRSSTGAIYENAAQVLNHDLYWRSLSPDGGGPPPDGELARAAELILGGDRDALGERIVELGAGLFGSGYVWLAFSPETGRLSLDALPNADSPLLQGHAPLLAIDVWEHSYYIDRRNGRAQYLRDCVDHLLDWREAEARLRKAREQHAGGAP